MLRNVGRFDLSFDLVRYIGIILDVKDANIHGSGGWLRYPAGTIRLFADVKPFSFSEVLIRAKTILRRTSKPAEVQKIKFEDLELDLLTRTVRREKTVIELHPKEFALLEYLLKNQGHVLSKAQILEKVWKYDFDPQTNVVDVLICRLRNKIDRDFKIKLIKTLRGVGYAIRTD